jgi:enamine deaminase RidA (YjgF/YER057c/UK114 family)
LLFFETFPLLFLTMGHIQGYNYPGYVEVANAFNMSAAVSFPANLRFVATSGQVADDHEVPWGSHVEQIEKAMRNVEKALAEASPYLADRRLLWSGVYNITSYHVGKLSEDEQLQVAGVVKEFLGSHRPAWTAVCVTALFAPNALVELQVQAAYKYENESTTKGEDL